MSTYPHIPHLLWRSVNSPDSLADNSFGPFLQLPDRETFDFTLLFEETILSILPSALLLLVIPPRIVRLWREPRKVPSNNFQTFKIAILAIFSILQIVNVVEISRSSLRTRASIAAAILTFLASVGLCLLSYIEHIKNVRPSSIINAYLILTLTFDIAQLRTRWLRFENPPVNELAIAILSLKVLILISEATEKRWMLFPSYSAYSPEATSGLVSRGLFWWLNPLFRLGFRHIIAADDLFTTDEALLSISLEKRFSRHWVRRANYPKKRTLVWATSRALLAPFAAGILPRLALTFFQFMQPLLINTITRLVGQPDTESTENRGWALIAAFGLVYIGLAIAHGAYQHKANRLATMTRGSLVNAIYTQTLNLPITSLDESAAVTLMSSDVERICEAILPIHTLWSSPMEIALAIWLLQREVGLALFGPLFVVIMALSVPFSFSGRMSNAQKTWIEKIQTRIDATAKMIQSIKGVKMLGINSKMSSVITNLRLDEVAKSIHMRQLTALLTTFANLPDIFTPAAAFTIFVIVASTNGQQLDVPSAFTTLSLIALLITPIRQIVYSVPNLIAALGCFDRIEAFLCLPTQRDHRMLRALSSRDNPRELGTLDGNLVSQSEFELSAIRPQSSPTIRVRNLTLAWSDEGDPVINDVSLNFSKGELTMIVGPVGCGKSSLLKGLLGETPSSLGNVYIDDSRTAFVDQIPWIQNGTIQQNIIGAYPFESEWYARVVHACAFDADLESFPQGDKTLVGSAGAAMSGGQRLRIALSRAVYSRPKVLILDDVFSGLDIKNEDRVFSRLLGRTGLLRQSHTIVILVTHAAHRLSYADHIIALDSNGNISEQGKFDFLLNNNGYVASLNARHTTEAEGTVKDNVVQAAGPNNDDTARQNATVDLERPTGNPEIYRYYLRSIGWPVVTLWMAAMITFSTLLRFPDLWLKFWTDAVSVHGNSVNGLYLGVLLGMGFIVLAALVSLVILLFTKMIPRSALNLHGRLLETVEKAPLSFFTSTDTGQILNRFSQDLGVIDMELPLHGLIFVHNAWQALIQAIFICISARYFAAVLPGIFAAMYILQRVYLRASRQIRLLDLEAKAPLYSNFLETLSGLVTIRAFNWSDYMETRNRTLLDASQRPFYLMYCVQRWLALVVDLLVAALGIILVALIVTFRKNADAGFVGVALVSIMSFNMTLSQVIQNWAAIETSLGAIFRIRSFVESTTSEDLVEERQDVPPDWPRRGDIVVSKATAAYVAEGEPILHDISISISDGRKIGICGPSGSGKSSFVALLFHMMEIQDGSIFVDGIDISKIPRQILRERLTVIPQDPIFMKGTIRQNLDPLARATDGSNLEDVLTKVGLWTIVKNAGGLDVPMEAEELLSHGQRQLFCLARAMLRTSRILIIDEATASVDLQTDELMQQIISEHFKECTVIAVAHRLQTIRDYDALAVFENGRIVELGEPDALLADKGSKFTALWNS